MSEQIKDGGCAFPVPMFQRESDGQPMTANDYLNGGNGMSLRDWFAGMAISGVIQTCKFDTFQYDHFSIEENFATKAYRIADAMIEARNKGGDI